MKRAVLAVIVLAGVIEMAAAGTARADGAWLDAIPIGQWNAPGMAIPAAPSGDDAFLNEPFCDRQQRYTETEEDDALVAAGWRLMGTYQSGWGVRIVGALSGYDGMCRPNGYNFFVFVDGVFAGTIAPEPMYSRTDGSGGQVYLSAPAEDLSATFSRYTAEDPLCCPSATTFVSYTIERTGTGPVVVAGKASTSPTQR
jgi:hypothetical protein